MYYTHFYLDFFLRSFKCSILFQPSHTSLLAMFYFRSQILNIWFRSPQSPINRNTPFLSNDTIVVVSHEPTLVSQNRTAVSASDSELCSLSDTRINKHQRPPEIILQKYFSF